MNKIKILYFLLCVFILAILFFVFKNIINLKTNTQSNMQSLGNKTFKASTKYANVEFTTSYDEQTLYIVVNYKDLTGVSAIHIHTNNNGYPGQILAWLGTSKEWQQGVAQNTPGANSPCGTENNPLCTFAAPYGTPYINDLSNTTRKFTVTNNNSKQCPWIKNGTFLDVHGFNFQKVINGQLTNEKPGADIISQATFT
jgi:hypothetical protein